MNANIIFYSCLGLLLVIFSKPLCEALNFRRTIMGERVRGDLAYRVSIIIVGLLFICLSFFYER